MLGSPPGLPGGGMTGILPASGVGNLISGSTPGGGQITPSDCARRLVRLSGGVAGLCGSASPVVAVPGDPGGNEGEHGGEPGAAGEVPCPSAGATKTDARTAAAKSATSSSQNFRVACHAFMQIQLAAQAQGSARRPRPELSRRRGGGFYCDRSCAFAKTEPVYGCP
jgi:hypothetical protein